MSSEIYDDSDFYELLLRSFVDQRRTNSDVFNAAQAAQAAAALKASQSAVKMRRNQDGQFVKVDTKASKGRKLRYTVHEKLQDFMAPVAEKRLGWWEERQVRELFGSLLGQRMLSEGEGLGGGNYGNEALLDQEDGLRVFG